LPITLHTAITTNPLMVLDLNWIATMTASDFNPELNNPDQQTH
jgi:hypothetical protein